MVILQRYHCSGYFAAVPLQLSFHSGPQLTTAVHSMLEEVVWPINAVVISQRYHCSGYFEAVPLQWATTYDCSAFNAGRGRMAHYCSGYFEAVPLQWLFRSGTTAVGYHLRLQCINFITIGSHPWSWVHSDGNDYRPIYYTQCKVKGVISKWYQKLEWVNPCFQTNALLQIIDI